ncbi:MAG: bifunctional 2-polyprenyl-6-hydroxyphenol methylase/3-demethylubiquinol 3-O-methyltransferase UbiG [Gammaproteobacteria bacterium]|nr:bifunctional 2-polyprenyl-6-hydroxyphenol methylase/3-demethylubiquinol 3-O-methyltransferase UbiG [Gammaproteobacteria bacterium]
MNIDDAEIGKFEALAHRWWDPNGDFRALHDINPLRLNYVAERAPLEGARVVDVGCGGGILAEAMAAAGAEVTGIDMAGKPLAVARLHALETGIELEYLAATPEDLAGERPGAFDTVTCMEMLEHVPDYGSSIAACADLAAPGGQLFFSTISRTPKAYLLAVLGAEYVLNILPKGTHDYARLIRPSELARAVRKAGLRVEEVAGMAYNPFSNRARLTRDTDVNYLLHASKP